MNRSSSGALSRLRTSEAGRARAGGPFGRSEVLALSALAFLVAVSAVWWAVALWPVAPAAPGWLQAARAVCFGAHEAGLPSAGGWILLVGEPIGMVAALLIVWRGPLLSGFAALLESGSGRGVVAVIGLALLAGLGAAGWRVTTASMATGAAAGAASPDAPSLTRLSGPAPPIRLLDQHGNRLELDRFRGRPVLVSFGYAHCETVCPLLVHGALEAQRQLDPAPAVVVVTLDPWRDVPSRLPRMAESWGMRRDAFVVGGEVDAVLRVLRAWKAEGARDPRTGEVVHTPVTYVLDRDGQLAYATTGTTDELVRAVHRLR